MRTRSIASAGLVLLVLSSSVTAQDRASADFDTVRVNDIHLVYRVAGQGEPLLMLHGFLGNSGNWDSVLPEFARRYRVILPDLRGHGHSTLGEGYTHRLVAGDMSALLDSLRIDRVKAIGFSTGAMTLLHLATADPDRVEAMALIGGASYMPEEMRSVVRGYHPDSLSAEFLASWGRPHSRGAEQARELFEIFNGFKDSYDDMTFTPPQLRTITASTLIIHGDRDALFPLRLPVEQYRSIPDAYLWVLPNTEHRLIPVTGGGKEAFVSTVLSFLAGEWK